MVAGRSRNWAAGGSHTLTTDGSKTSIDTGASTTDNIFTKTREPDVRLPSLLTQEPLWKFSLVVSIYLEYPLRDEHS